MAPQHLQDAVEKLASAKCTNQSLRILARHTSNLLLELLRRGRNVLFVPDSTNYLSNEEFQALVQQLESQ